MVAVVQQLKLVRVVGWLGGIMLSMLRGWAGDLNGTGEKEDG